jgi:hypothetical protein
MPLAIKLIGGFIALAALLVFARSYVLGGGGEAGPSADLTDSMPVAAATAPSPDAVQASRSQGPGRAAGAGQATGDSPPYAVLESSGTLGSLAVQFNMAPGILASWINDARRLNNMAAAPSLQAGQEPAVSATAAGPVPEAFQTQSADSLEPLAAPSSTPAPDGDQGDATPTPTSSPSGRTYTVKAGDTLLKIAHDLCVLEPAHWIQEIININDELFDIKDVEEETLSAGMELELPASTPVACPTPVPNVPSPIMAPALEATATPTPTSLP